MSSIVLESAQFIADHADHVSVSENGINNLAEEVFSFSF